MSVTTLNLPVLLYPMNNPINMIQIYSIVISLFSHYDYGTPN